MENYKIGYVYSPTTKEFIGEEIVYLEKRTGKYPCADNVVFVEPLETKKNQTNIWDEEKWILVDDFRGFVLYDKKGNPEGVVDHIGKLYDNEIITEPPKTILNEHEHLKWNGNKWIVELENLYIYDNDKIRLMTEVEMIQSGKKELPENMKIINDELLPKTRDDLFNEGKLTTEEYNKEVDEERQARYTAETDKMGLMYLRGECTIEEWKAAMDKIREELPKKEVEG